MKKRCKYCKKWFEGSPRKKYCSPKCKKNYENSLRSVYGRKQNTAAPGKDVLPSKEINRPKWLNDVAATCWDRIAPVLIKRGHLNILSENAFAELCDLYSTLKSINKTLHDEEKGTTFIRTPVGEQGYMSFWLSTSAKRDIPPQSVFSNLKRNYLKLFLLYCKEFYLTSLSVEDRD